MAIEKSKILAILRNNEFVNSAAAGDEVEVALDKTPFYATMGGQVGDAGELVGIMNIIETFPIDGLVIHKGNLIADAAVGDMANAVVNGALRAQTARAHTAAHLLQAALRKVLGDTVEQRGSKVSPDSVRFDFLFPRPMTDSEKAETERLINEWIAADLPVATEELPIEEAKSRGAMALFGEKYGDTVRMVSAGDISIELCGGTHITHTGEIKGAKINKEKSIASGIRRITMSVGDQAK
ncbi:MAG: hypothetical protein LBJ18_02925 [Rickettsiales bacterium]|jgi:alanyl-tRNA synthetase|nr:hypothetical protein [Rickettsiales bacterium]